MAWIYVLDIRGFGLIPKLVFICILECQVLLDPVLELYGNPLSQYGLVHDKRRFGIKHSRAH